MRKVSASLREMFSEETDRTLNYNELERTIIEEAEQYNRIHIATSYNDDVHTFYPLCVFDGLKAYIVFSKEFIWVKHVERNPRVALTTYNKQFLGEAKILGDPYDDKFWRIRVKFRAKHRLSWDRCINIPKLALIEIRVTHVTLMDYSNEYVPYWKVTHLDAERKEAFWHYILEEFPYWHQIQEPMSLKPRMDSMTVPPPDDSKGDGQ